MIAQGTSSRNKRDRSPDSCYLPSLGETQLSKRPRQESIITALNPTIIAKKREKVEEEKKLPHDVQEKINLRAFELVVGDALPLHFVESVFFRNYSMEIDPRINVMCSKLLLAKEFVSSKSDVKREFQIAPHVCLTADVWGAKNRSFMGVTAHWLKIMSDGTIKRIPAAIACKRFPGIGFH